MRDPAWGTFRDLRKAIPSRLWSMIGHLVKVKEWSVTGQDGGGTRPGVGEYARNGPSVSVSGLSGATAALDRGRPLIGRRAEGSWHG